MSDHLNHFKGVPETALENISECRKTHVLAEGSGKLIFALAYFLKKSSYCAYLLKQAPVSLAQSPFETKLAWSMWGFTGAVHGV